MKTVLFVPGFQEDITSRDYGATIRAIERQGYGVVFVPISWSRTTIYQWTLELDKVYEKYNPATTILAGFSYGAMTAFMSASKRNPLELWLFSLSPYFAEDLISENMKQEWLHEIGIRRTKAFSKISFLEHAKEIGCKTLLFAGQLEIDKYPVIGERAMNASKLLSQATLTIVPKAGHDVTNQEYIQAISKQI